MVIAEAGPVPYTQRQPKSFYHHLHPLNLSVCIDQFGSHKQSRNLIGNLQREIIVRVCEEIRNALSHRFGGVRVLYGSSCKFFSRRKVVFS